MKTHQEYVLLTSTVVHDDEGRPRLTVNVRRNRSRVMVVEVNGELEGGAPVTCFLQTMAALMNVGESYIVLNLRRASRIDGSGLRAILGTAFTTCEQQGGKFAIVRPRRHCLGKFLRKTTIETLARICASESIAVEALFQWSVAA